MPDEVTRRQKVKEVAETVDAVGKATLTWVKVLGGTGVGLTTLVQGTAIIDLLQRVVG